MNVNTELTPCQQDSITLLRSAENKLLTKIHRRTADGWVTTPYTHTTYFTAREVAVGSLDDLEAILSKLQRKEYVCVVRGTLIEPNNTKPIVRKLRGEQPTFKASDRFWVGFDLDDVPAQEGFDPECPESRARAVRHVITTILPPAFHDAACVYSWTSSAGVKGWDQLRLRVWFWGDRPICDESLREYFKGFKGVDTKVFNPVQVHYTAAPVFEGIPDPLAGFRFGRLDGSAVVEFPEQLQAQREHDERKAIESAQRELDKPVVEVISLDDVRTQTSLQGEIEQACATIRRSSGLGRHPAVEKAVYRIIGLVKAGYLTTDQLIDALTPSANVALAGDRDGRNEVARLVTWAMQADYFKARYLEAQAVPVDLAPDADADRFPTLEALREALPAIVEHAVNAPGIHVIKSPTGAGKTTALLTSDEGIARGILDGKTGMIAVPSNELKDEFHDATKRAILSKLSGDFFEPALNLNKTLVVEVTRTADNCDKLGEYLKHARKGPDWGAWFCKQCPKRDNCEFVRERHKNYKAKVLFTTHEALTRKVIKTPDHLGNVVVGWSEIAKLNGERVRPILRHTNSQSRVTVEQIGANEYGFDVPPIDYIKGQPLLDDERDEILTALAHWLHCAPDAKTIARVLFEQGDFKTSDDFLIIDEDITSTLMKELAIDRVQLVNAIECKDIALPQERWLALSALLDESTVADERGFYKPILSDRVNEALKGELTVNIDPRVGAENYHAARQAFMKYKSTGDIAQLDTAPDYEALEALMRASHNGFEGVKILNGELVVPHVRIVDFTRHASSVVILDATITPDIARALFGEHVQFHDLQVEKPASLNVINVTKPITTRMTHEGAFRSDQTRNTLALVAAQFDSPKTVWGLPGKSGWFDQSDDAEITQWLNSLQGAKLYPNATDARGSNKYEGCDTLIMCEFHVPKHAVESRALQLCISSGEPWIERREHWIEQAKYQLEIAPVIQLIGRVRPLNSTEQRPLTIVFLGSDIVSKYEHVLSIDRYISMPGFALVFEVENTPNGIYWPNLQKGRSPAISLVCSQSHRFLVSILTSNLPNREHSSTHAGDLDFALKTSCATYYANNWTEYAHKTGLKTVELRTSQGGVNIVGIHNGFDTEQVREQLRERAAVEGWSWFEFEGVREQVRESVEQIENEIINAINKACTTDGLASTAVEIYAQLAEILDVSASTVRRRLSFIGMQVDEIRDIASLIADFDDLTKPKHGYYAMDADEVADEMLCMQREYYVEKAHSIEAFRIEHKQYVRRERSRAWYAPTNFANPYPEPLSFARWLIEIWIPTHAPDEWAAQPYTTPANEVAQ